MKTLYDQDFYHWCLQQAELLEQGHFNELDLDNVVEETRCFGSDKEAPLERVICHIIKAKMKLDLFKHEHQEANQWRYIVKTQTEVAMAVIKANPSIIEREAFLLDYAYHFAIFHVNLETGVNKEQLAATYQWTLAELLPLNS